jgi:SPP1 family phage portal protein
MAYTGRRKILSDEVVITEHNVIQVLTDALLTHSQNSVECDYLYRYRRGKQPILERVKEVRPEICNKMVENHADEIITFKTGYLCGEPLQYISRGSTDDVSRDINALNDMMLLCGKSALDKELAEWMYTCGTGYRIVLANSDPVNNEVVPALKSGQKANLVDEAPFETYVLDPRYTFVVYHSGLGEKPLMAVKYVVRQDKSVVYSVYTYGRYFEITETETENDINVRKEKEKLYNITVDRSTALKAIPIIEYPLNGARLGAFEIVLPILDAINTVQSNRIDGVEQFIQSLLVFINCDIDTSDPLFAQNLREAGMVKIKTVGEIKADIKEIAEALDQQQTQTLIDYLYQTVLNIVGMPNRNGGSSTSDTGAATIVRDGWATAEARAKLDELSFKESERKFLKLVLGILRDTVGTSLTLADIETKFTRRNYENIMVKAQVLDTMLKNNKIAPELAFTHCGMFSDPEDAAKQSAAYYEKVKAELADQNKQVEPQIQDESDPAD